MPIYEFECRQCGAGFERLQKLSDPDPEQCPACSASGSIRRRISAPSFRLAGSGWYETDFKSDKDSRRNLAGSESASAGNSGAGTAAGGDGKSSTGGTGTASATPSTTSASSTAATSTSTTSTGSGTT